MCFLLRVIALLLVLAAPAAAQEIIIGRGAICDTQKQTERLIALLDGGAEAAVDSVNAEENDPTACAIATVAFVEGPEIAISRSKNGTYRIVTEISITGAIWISDCSEARQASRRSVPMPSTIRFGGAVAPALHACGSL